MTKEAQSSKSEVQKDWHGAVVPAKEIRSVRLLYTKAALFVVGGIVACVLILLEHPTVKTAVLLAIAIWCFARAYYFAFYVVSHYVDPSYRFSGLGSFVRYLCSRDRRNDP
ncbi:MAG: hypothetical protein ABFC96_09790 [Thermoguttaceae bacterium]